MKRVQRSLDGGRGRRRYPLFVPIHHIGLSAALLYGCVAEGELTGMRSNPVLEPDGGSAGLPAYGSDGLPDDSAELFSYVKVGVFEASCQFSECHHAGSGAAAGLDLVTDPRSALLGTSSATGRPLVVPGEPERSYLIEKLTSASPEAGQQMPLSGVLASDQLLLVRRWIETGAMDTAVERTNMADIDAAVGSDASALEVDR